MVIRLKLNFPDTCPACNSGTLWFDYQEGVTDQSNVKYICDHCNAEYDWRMLADIMLQRGVTDGQSFIRGFS